MIIKLLEIFILSMLFISLFFSKSLSLTTIELKESVCLTEKEIFLKDIAKLSNPALNTIYIGKLPLPGRKRYITQEYVKLRILQAKIKERDFKLTGAKKVEISDYCQKLDIEAVIKIAKKYLLDKRINVDTVYRAEPDKYYVIKEVGTNSTTKATVYIADAPVLELLDKQSPLFKVNTNLNGLLDLENLYLVLPPDKTLRFTGSSGSYMRIKGEIGQLEPGEVLPAAFMARYTEQAKIGKRYQAASYSFAVNATVAAGAETTVLTFTCPAGEEWEFKELYMAEQIDTDGAVDDRFHSRIYIEDKPYDIVDTAMGPLGIVSGSAPYPAREARNFRPFTLKDWPIKLTVGKTLKITMINTGAAYTPATGYAVEYFVHLVGIKKIL